MTISIATGKAVSLPVADDGQVAALIAVLPDMSDPDTVIDDWQLPGTDVRLSAITKTRGPEAHNALSVVGDSKEGELEIHCCRAKGRIAAKMIKSIHESSEVQIAASLLERSPPRPWVLFYAPEPQLMVVAVVVAAWQEMSENS